MAPGSAALVDHLKTVNVREDAMVVAVNGWIGRLFDRDHLDETVTALVESQGGPDVATKGRERAKARLADAEQRLRRYQAVVAAGVEPAALVDVINAAQTERAAAQAEIDNAGAQAAIDVAEVYAMVDSLGDVGTALREAKPTELARLYRELDLELRYEPAELAVYATARPRVDSARVRGGT